ncbi:hypothetical protein HNQ56_003434 [Anaerotaenia torta]|uniref:M1 family aminopeptidase n=1 Tax=Anaerotaenia torta TaxID=433293 RepID=UPI003D22A138
MQKPKTGCLTPLLMHEIRRMLGERMTLLIMALTGAGTVWFCLNGQGRTASDIYMVSAAQSSAFLGALLFTLLSLAQFHRDYKNNTDVIILAATDPLRHQIRRTLALICTAVVTTLLISVFTLWFGMIKTDSYFQTATFLSAWYLIFLGSLIFAVLLSMGISMLTGHVGAAFIIMMGLIFLSIQLRSMYTLNPSYLLYWVQTTAYNFSDLVPNQFQIDMLLWNRLFCLPASLGIWALGLCSFRRYRQGLPGSFSVNCRRIWPPLLLASSILLAGIIYVHEPLFDDSKPTDFSNMVSSGTGIIVSSGDEPKIKNPELMQTEKSFELDIRTGSRKLSGTARYKLYNGTGEPQSLPVLINAGLKINRIRINGAAGEAIRGETGENSIANWNIKLPAASEYEVEINYSGGLQNNNTILQVALYGISRGFVRLPVFAVAPSLDIRIAEDGAFSGTLLLDEELEPVFTLGKAEKRERIDGKIRWQYTGNKGSQGTGILAAEYGTSSFEAGGLAIQLKYFRKHEESIASMDAVNVIKAAIDYFTDAYGPLRYSGELIMLELPAYVSGGFATGTISAMDETSFASEGYLPADPSNLHGSGGIDVLVHEIAHQWWGLATMPVQDTASGWSAEGITCYSTYCFMKEYFGEEYAQERYTKDWQKSWDTYRNAFYIRNPEYLAKLSEADASNIMGSFLNRKLYDLMPLMMLKAEALLGGTGEFQSKLSQLYKTHLGQTITYDDFLAIIGLTKEAIELA